MGSSSVFSTYPKHWYKKHCVKNLWITEGRLKFEPMSGGIFEKYNSNAQGSYGRVETYDGRNG